MILRGNLTHGWATYEHKLSVGLGRLFKNHWFGYAMWGILGLALLTVPVQLLYPANRVLPGTSVGGLGVGGQSREQLLVTFSDYANNGETTIATPSKQWRSKWQDIGLTIDPEASAQVALDYPLWERFIPLSSLIKIAQSRQLPMVALVDNDRLESFAAKVVTEDAQAARNATIRVENDQVVIDDAKNGYAFDNDRVKSQIRRLVITSTSVVVRLVPDTVPPVRPASSLQALKTQAEEVLAHTPTLTVDDKTFTPDRATIGSWIGFTEDEHAQLGLQFKTDDIKRYLEEVNKQIAIDPGTITVSLLDGVEVGRTQAPQGRSVALDSTVEKIVTALKAQEHAPKVALQIANVPPRVNTVRNYSQTSEGLRAIIRDWEATVPGDYGVIVRELEGQRRYAEWQPDKKFVTASTFKMFVAYVLLKKINEGLISWGQITDIGWTVDACLTEMIVNSTNPCSVSFLNLMGWAETQRLVNEAGFVNTLINNGCCEEKHSTVRDETNFLLKLNAGTLLDAGGSERLLSMMKRQVWRSGIPSGVPKGVTVADKVGFYAGYIHDVAIVYGPKGTYILGIMSYGGSNPSMAELSRRVYNFFNN